MKIFLKVQSGCRSSCYIGRQGTVPCLLALNHEIQKRRRRAVPCLPAQSSGTVIIRSDKGKGGTWAGATENLKHAWCPTFCRDCEYPGNQELIKLGAIPVTDDWDGDVSKYHTEPVKLVELVREPEQISMLDVL